MSDNELNCCKDFFVKQMKMKIQHSRSLIYRNISVKSKTYRYRFLHLKIPLIVFFPHTIVLVRKKREKYKKLLLKLVKTKEKCHFKGINVSKLVSLSMSGKLTNKTQTKLDAKEDMSK